MEELTLARAQESCARLATLLSAVIKLTGQDSVFIPREAIGTGVLNIKQDSDGNVLIELLSEKVFEQVIEALQEAPHETKH